jgi:hypothetical protein
MPEPSNTVAVVTGRRIGLRRATTSCRPAGFSARACSTPTCACSSRRRHGRRQHVARRVRPGPQPGVHSQQATDRAERAAAGCGPPSRTGPSRKASAAHPSRPPPTTSRSSTCSRTSPAPDGHRTIRNSAGPPQLITGLLRLEPRLDLSTATASPPGLDVYKVAGKVFPIVTDDPGDQIVTVKGEPEHARAQECGYASMPQKASEMFRVTSASCVAGRA